MTAYTLANNATLRDIGNASIWGVTTARTGGDTVSTNGFNLTIDQDSRYGLSGGTAFSWGALTVLATKGGDITFDGRFVRMIPFTGGSGTITLGTLITVGSGTGKVIGIYTSMTAAPATTGASGWIKVTEWNSVAFATSGAFTQAGFTFTVSGASIVGFIDIIGDEAATINANRLGNVSFLGEWFALGTTTGVANQTVQIPNHGLQRYGAGVFIEKTVGSNDYEFYPNAGTATTIGTDAFRGKVVWIDNTGLVRIGHNGTTTMGYTPVVGLKIVIGNIFLENCTTAARAANVIPNATIATRYDFTCTGGGVVIMDKVNCAWYASFSQAYSVTITNSGFVDGVLFSEIATPMTHSKIGVGNKPTTALLVSPLTMSLCFAGGSFTDCVWARVSMAASGAYSVTINDIAGFDFVRDTIRANTIRGNATTYAINGTRMVNCNYINPTIIQGAANLITCTNTNFTNTTYIGAVSGTTVTTYTGYVWQVSSNTLNCKFEGLSLPVTNNQPYTALLSIAAAGCANIKLRNIGTRTSPVTLGSTNGTGLIYVLGGGAAASDIKIQRVYCSNTRTGVMTGDNSSTRIYEDNVYGDYADAADVLAVLNYFRRGRGTSSAYTAQTAIYGTHWTDHFTSATAGRIAILMNETTSLTASQVTLGSGVFFTSAGSLYMPTINHEATFEMPYYCLGHTGFSNTALIMAGGTATNYNYQYQIDKNDGNGFSAWSASLTATTLGTGLSGITGINPALGFKLRLKIITTVTNTTAITSVYVTTTSTAVAQDNQYVLDTVNLTLTSLKPNTEIRAYVGTDPISAIEIGGIENSGTEFSFTHSVGGQAGYIQIIANGYQIISLPITYSSIDQSIPIQQQFDRQYANI